MYTVGGIWMEGWENGLQLSFNLGFIKYNMMRTMHKQDEQLGTHNQHVIQKECQTHCHSKQLQLHPFPWFRFESAVKPEDFCPTHSQLSQLRIQFQQNELREMVETRFSDTWTGDVQMFQHRMLYTLLSSMEAVTYDFSILWSPKCEIFWEDVSCFDHFHSGHRPGPKGCFKQFAGHRPQMPTWRISKKLFQLKRKLSLRGASSIVVFHVLSKSDDFRKKHASASACINICKCFWFGWYSFHAALIFAFQRNS